jgi:hypothetical protein
MKIFKKVNAIRRLKYRELVLYNENKLCLKCNRNRHLTHSYCKEHFKPIQDELRIIYKNKTNKRCCKCGKLINKSSNFCKRRITGKKGVNLANKNGQWNGGSSPSYHKRLIRKYYNKCQICDGIIKLNTHHIDGNRKNNKLNNLSLLCSSCHSSIHYNRNKLKFRGNG